MRSIALSLMVLAGLVTSAQGALIGVTPGLPLMFANVDGSNAYDAGSDLFSVDATPFLARTSPDEMSPDFDITVYPTGNPPSAQMTIRIHVDENGNLTGGDPNGPDFIVVGELTSNSVTYSGTLLTGEIKAFGFAESGDRDQFDFHFSLTGGELEELYGDSEIGVVMTSENSTFTGSFAVDFGGGPTKLNIGPYGSCPDAQITGTVYCDQTGAQLPVEGVTVTVSDSNNNPVGSAVTDQNGQYTIGELAPASYTVVVTPPQGTTPCSPETVSVNLDCGQTGTADFCLCDSCPDAQITGTVYCDETGVAVPIDGVRVTVYDSENNEVDWTVTDANGQYTIDELAPGAYSVVVTPLQGTTPCSPETVSVNLGCGQTGTADFCVCRENVCEEKICIKVICDQDGKPVKDAKIILWGPKGLLCGSTGEDGTKCFSGDKIKDGWYVVKVFAPSGYQLSGSCYYKFNLAECEMKEITVIACPKQVCEESVCVNVVVRDEDGDETPAADVSVKLWSYYTGNLYDKTNSEGEKCFTGYKIKPGSYKVTVTPPSGYRICDGEPNYKCFTLDKCEHKQLKFCIEKIPVCEESLCVNVYEDKNGQRLPVQGVKVVVWKKYFEKKGSTDSTGQVCFDEHVKPAEYYVKIEVPAGYESCDGKTCKKVCIDKCENEVVEFCLRKKQQSGGTQGCTPGYWKNHTHKWPSEYPKHADFDTVFGVNAFHPNITLYTAVKQGGGGVKALGRHAVAALLNAANPHVNYGMTPQEVIALVQAALAPGGDVEGTKNLLCKLNERGCPLN